MRSLRRRAGEYVRRRVGEVVERVDAGRVSKDVWERGAPSTPPHHGVAMVLARPA